MIRTRVHALLLAPLLFAATGRQRPARTDSLRDALATGQWIGYYGAVPVNRLTRIVTRAAAIVDNFPYRIATLGPPDSRRVILEAWSGEGTGWAQMSYWVFETETPDSVRLLWTAVAAERSDPGTPKMRREYPPYEIRSCLLLWGKSGLAYSAWGLPKFDRGDTPPALQAGYYAWSDSARTFVLARPADAALVRRCRANEHRIRNRA